MAAITQLAVPRAPRGAPVRPAAGPGIAIDAAGQLALLERLAADYRQEWSRFPGVPAAGCRHEYIVRNRFFESVDGQMLYALVRHFKPRRIVEVGSGFSTCLIAEAMRRNREDGREAALTAIEPFPNGALRGGLAGLEGLRVAAIRDVELSLFTDLAANDVLFVNSAHDVHLASELRYQLLEVVPRLKPGVLVHFHDIFLPAHYPRDWIESNRFFWTEQYALQAFLGLRGAFEVLWAAYWMHLNHPDRLAAAFPSYDRATSWPASFWMRKEEGAGVR